MKTQKIVADANVDTLNNHIATNRIDSVLPRGMDIKDVIDSLANNSGFIDCLSADNYKIID